MNGRPRELEPEDGIGLEWRDGSGEEGALVAGEPVQNEMANKREQDGVVACAACLAGAAEAVMASVHAPGSEGPS